MKIFLVLFSAVGMGLIGVLSASAQQPQCTTQTLRAINSSSETCPGACLERCLDDKAFLNKNVVSCGRLERNAQSDPAVRDATTCGVPDEPAGSKFGSCLSKAGTIKRRNTGRAKLEELLASAPTCAATPFALNEMYACLGSETDTIRDLFEPLVSRGYVIVEDEAMTPESPICIISNTRIDKDELMAESLTTQSTILSKEFSVVSACRREWEGWLNEASSKCDTSATGSCEQGIDAVIGTMQHRIQPAEAREVEIEGIIDGIARQLEQITGVILVRNLICPPVD